MSQARTASEGDHARFSNAASPLFATRHWTVVLSAGRELSSADARQALETPCRTYWYPLNAFVRRQGKNAEDAQDATQEFYARLLAKGSIGLADAARECGAEFALPGLPARTRRGTDP